jgi:uncharacterized repeat protein (TIGR01451 family)
MKSRSFLIFLLILSLAVVPSMQLAFAAASSSSSSSSSTTTTTTSTAPKSPFSERLDIYTAGTNDYWLVTLNPVNATKPDIIAAESVAGVSAYELTAIQTSTASSGSPLFWSDGYGVVKLPFMPYSGVFLNVTATSQSAAQSAASDFDSLIGVNLQQIGSGGGNYTFFGSANFAIAGATIFNTVPVADKGLAGIVTESSLAGDPTPTAILTGVRSGPSFTHKVVFGSTEPTSIGSNGSLLLEDALSLQNDSFVSSANATSTQIVVHSLDGLMKSSDNATITNDEANFSSTYSISVPPGVRFRPNVTLLQDPPVLTVTRSLNGGSATSGGLVSVTLNFVNTADNGTIDNISVNDSWWTAYPSLFSLSAGNSGITIGSLGPGQNVSRAYVLKVTSSTSEDLIVPAVTVPYSYAIGNGTVHASAKTNEIEVRTNNPGPAMVIQAGSSLKSGSALGKAGSYLVTVTNEGNAPALDLHVLNFTNPTLTPGSAWTINESLPVTSIVDRNLTQMFTLGWTEPDGSNGTLVSNPATVVLSHTGISIPYVQFRLTATISSTELALGSINATYVLGNRVSPVAQNVTVNQPFPAGMTCKTVLSGNATCGSSGLSLTVSPLGAFANVTGTVLLTFSKDNYLIQPATILTTAGGINLHTAGSGLPIAAGLSVTKTFLSTGLFVGQDDNVTVRATNHGSLPVYNVTLTTNPDPFDASVSGALDASYATLNPGSSQSFNYTVRMLSAGNHTGASTSLEYLFGGFASQYPTSPTSSSSVLVYKPVQVTTAMTSSSVEGSDFSFAVAVQNPSPVNVTNVSLSIPLPLGITIVNYSAGFQVNGRTVTLEIPSLAAGATSTHSLTLKSDLDGSFNIGNGTVSFNYLGTTVKGVLSTPAIVVGVAALLRYEVPIGVAVILTLAVAVYMHRKLVVQTKGPASG